MPQKSTLKLKVKKSTVEQSQDDGSKEMKDRSASMFINFQIPMGTEKSNEEHYVEVDESDIL